MPEISKITLPSGNTYDIKDATARQMISGGVSFNIVWSQIDYETSTAPSSARLSSVPSGVVVHYNSGGSSATGTLTASADYTGQFYLIYDQTESLNYFDEYVVVEENENYYWEKIGDTSVDLSGLVTDVTTTSGNFVTSLGSASTDSVIGADATFTVTQPTINVTPSRTYLGASASGANTAWNSKDQKTVVTGYASPSTDTFVKSVTAETDKNLVTTTVTGVQSNTTTASKATAATSQTTATGSGTASSTNTDWLKGVSVSNETLVIGAATMNTQTTTQFTFSNVTVPIKNSSATTVATGSTSSSGTGDAVVTGVTVGDSASAITGLGTASTANVIGASSTFTITQPTVALSSNSSTATGRVQVATGISSATATNGNVAWNSKDATTVVTDLGTPLTASAITSVTAVKN